MIVVSLTDCPPRVRGDLSKWLMEINAGVYVGNVSARVRDELWERICEHIKEGRATMVFSAKNEQGMSFRVHNTTWESVDFDGIRLMRRPMARQTQTIADSRSLEGASKAAQNQKTRKMQAIRSKFPTSYVVIDLETSGLSVAEDQIIEVAAIRVIEGKVEAEFEQLVHFEGALPANIVQLTGITDRMLREQGAERKHTVQSLIAFMGDLPIVSHNAAFDVNFLRMACRQDGIAMPRGRIIDTMDLSRRSMKHLPDYKLATIARAFDIEPIRNHRALADCRILQKVYEKLNEKA